MKTSTFQCPSCGLSFRARPASGGQAVCPKCGPDSSGLSRAAPSSSRILRNGNEVHLRRMRVEDALIVLDKALDELFLQGVPTVRVIHGKGTGTLRQVAREALSVHPLVKSFRPAFLHEGGEGVTIAELWSPTDKSNP